jgi:hypothetical protein
MELPEMKRAKFYPICIECRSEITHFYNERFCGQYGCIFFYINSPTATSICSSARTEISIIIEEENETDKEDIKIFETDNVQSPTNFRTGNMFLNVKEIIDFDKLTST